MGGGVGWRSRDFAVGSAGARPENFRCWVLGSWRWVTGSAVGWPAGVLGRRWVGVGPVVPGGERRRRGTGHRGGGCGRTHPQGWDCRRLLRGGEADGERKGTPHTTGSIPFPLDRITQNPRYGLGAAVERRPPGAECGDGVGNILGGQRGRRRGLRTSAARWWRQQGRRRGPPGIPGLPGDGEVENHQVPHVPTNSAVSRAALEEQLRFRTQNRPDFEAEPRANRCTPRSKGIVFGGYIRRKGHR
jgi:hypothetical protein